MDESLLALTHSDTEFVQLTTQQIHQGFWIFIRQENVGINQQVESFVIT